MMKLPLELREEFGNYAFPDADYGAKAIEPILPFLETIADGDDNEFRTLYVSRDNKNIFIAKSKKLSNVILNLEKVMSPKQMLKEGVPIAVGTPYISDSITFLLLVFQFIRWAVNTTIDLTPLEAKILYKFYEKAASGQVEREILRTDFECYVQSEIEPQTLNSSLEKLEKLGCIMLTADKIRLVEQIIFVPEYENAGYFKTS